MGAGDSKLSFKKGVFRLSEETNIPANDPYWLSFWELPESAEDVFTLFSAADIRRTRDAHLENLETLILTTTSRLFVLRRHASFPDAKIATERDALNCIRILTRLLPFIYESDALAIWEEKFFWGARRRRRVREASGGEVLFDENIMTPQQFENVENEYEDAPPLMEELIDVLIDLLFYSGFTLPLVGAGKPRVSHAIWQSGVGCNTPVGTTKEGESNKIEVLRLLLAITSKAMFMPASVLPVKGERSLTYLVCAGNKRIVLSVLCSLLNTTLKYNPASWRVPYDHVVFTDPRQVLVTYSLQMLLVLLLYPVPESVGPGVKNQYRHYLGRLHRTQDFQFCVDGMTRILNQPIQATTSYLPGSQKSLRWAPEMMMLFWEALQCNKRFRSFIIETDRVHDFVVLIVYYALEYRLDPSKSGVVRMCVFVLQTLSTEGKFGKSLNKRFEGQATLPASVRIPSFSGSYADYLIISIYTLITTSKGKLGAVYPALLAIVANIAPHVQNLSSTVSIKLIQLFTSMSAPSFLLANDTNHNLLHSLLESMNAILEHQYTANSNFVYAILRTHKRFESLHNFTLESAQEDLTRSAMARKDTGRDSLDSQRPQEDDRLPPLARANMTDSLPTSPGTFEIGDCDDSDEESEEKAEDNKTNTPATTTQPKPAPSPITPISPTTTTPMTTGEPPTASPIPTTPPLDTVPPQLRGMSEKARGKLPEGAFRRQGSTTSLSSHHSISAPPSASGFAASHMWLESWLPHLPLHTILTIILQLQPAYERIVVAKQAQATNTTPTATTPAGATVRPSVQPMQAESMLAHIRMTPLRGIEPTPVKTHMFEWSPLALGWYESLLWGFIYVSERHVSKGAGTMGVWNGTAVRLFRVQETPAEGPTLMAPRGGVDAVGMSLVERLGSVTIGRRNTETAGTGMPPSVGNSRRGSEEAGRTAVV